MEIIIRYRIVTEDTRKASDSDSKHNLTKKLTLFSLKRTLKNYLIELIMHLSYFRNKWKCKEKNWHVTEESTYHTVH